MKGFTLVELIIVLGITTILLLATIPVAVRFLKTQNLDEVTETLLVTLRQAHTQARAEKNDASFGVRFESGNYIMFQGSSYAARTTAQDITISVPANITISGITEIVFTKRTGIPSTTGTILVQSTTESRSISINAQGLVESL